jgi:small neutral amino acid transporter SnatA (MarC family)
MLTILTRVLIIFIGKFIIYMLPITFQVFEVNAVVFIISLCVCVLFSNKENWKPNLNKIESIFVQPLTSGVMQWPSTISHKFNTVRLSFNYAKYI